jgi:hypothetical protein
MTPSARGRRGWDEVVRGEGLLFTGPAPGGGREPVASPPIPRVWSVDAVHSGTQSLAGQEEGCAPQSARLRHCQLAQSRRASGPLAPAMPPAFGRGAAWSVSGLVGTDRAACPPGRTSVIKPTMRRREGPSPWWATASLNRSTGSFTSSLRRRSTSAPCTPGCPRRRARAQGARRRPERSSAAGIGCAQCSPPPPA